MKKLFTAIMLLVISIGLVACGGGGSNEDVDEATDTLKIWADSTYWGGENEIMVKEMISKYTDETGIEVIYEALPDLAAKVSGAKMGGESADVVIWDRWQTTQFIDQEAIVNLNDYIERDGIDIAEYQQEALQEMMEGDDVYGFPLDIDAWGYWVNKDLLRKAGIEKLPETWDELRDAAIKTTEYDDSGNIKVAGLNMDCGGSFYSFIQTAGGELFSEDYKEVIFNSEAGRSVLTFWYELVKEHKVYTKDVSGGGGGANDPFVTQKIAIQSNSLLNGSKFYETYIGDKFDYEFIPYPKGPSSDLADGERPANSHYGGMIGGFGLVIPKTTRHKSAAWDLIKWWITDTQNQVTWAEISGLIPAKLSIQDEPALQSRPNVRTVLKALPYLKARPTTKVPGYSSIETTVFMAKIDELLFGTLYIKGNKTKEARIQACLDDMEKTAQRILDFAK